MENLELVADRPIVKISVALSHSRPGLKNKSIPLVGINFSVNEKIWSATVLFCQFAISIGLPLLGLLTYMSYSSEGIQADSCCQGSGMSFGFLSGIIFALFQRNKN